MAKFKTYYKYFRPKRKKRTDRAQPICSLRLISGYLRIHETILERDLGRDRDYARYKPATVFVEPVR